MLVPVDREARAAAEDEIHLLVSELRLGVLLYHLAARSGRVGVDAECADVEAAPHRPPDETVIQLDAVELVDVGVRHPISSATAGLRAGA